MVAYYDGVGSTRAAAAAESEAEAEAEELNVDVFECVGYGVTGPSLRRGEQPEMDLPLRKDRGGWLGYCHFFVLFPPALVIPAAYGLAIWRLTMERLDLLLLLLDGLVWMSVSDTIELLSVKS